MSSQARLKSRTQAVRVLYELSQTDHSIDAVVDRHLSQPILNDQDEDGAPRAVTAPQRALVTALVRQALENRHAMDALILDVAPNTPPEDMPVLQRAVLHIAIAELRYLKEQRGETPVIINAAVEIARAYVGDSAARLVNGILGTVAARYSPTTQR